MARNMHPEIARLYKTAKKLHEEIYKLVSALKADVNSTANLEELANRTYGLREIIKYTEDIHNEVKKTHDVYQKITALLYVQAGEGGPIRTEYATCTPKVRLIAVIPKKRRDPEKYNALMRFLNVPPELYAGDEEFEIVRPHWPGLVAHLSELMSQGQPLPPGIDPESTYPEYTCVTRGKKEPDEQVAS
jgi:hypothetical protein